MRGKIYLILLFSTFIFHFAAGQNPYTYSLLIKLKGEGTPVEERLKIYELLVDKYRSEQQYDEATAYCKEYLKLAKATKHPLETTKAYVYMGVILCNQEDYNKVHFYIDSATASASKTNDKIAEAYANFLPAYYEHSL
ncbi:hypothetical protein KRE38_19000, partial [Elizabethkingia meningoseptica]|nr:hypothetical protein [Elizabethkingia meningoseptica]